jgi:serine/threonine protein kinase
MMAIWVSIQEGTERGKIALLPDRPEVAIGRGRDNDLVIADPTVSRHHCRLLRTGDEQFAVVNLSGGQKVLLNGREVERGSIRLGDRIGLGSCVLILQSAPEGAPTGTPHGSGPAVSAGDRKTSATAMLPADGAPPVRASGSIEGSDTSDTSRYRPPRQIEDYLVEGDPLYDGGQATVYKVHHKDTGETFALKLFRDTGRDPEAERRYQTEVAILRKITHRNIVRYHRHFPVESDLGETRHCLVTEFLVGETLKDALARHRKGMPWDRAFEIMDQCLTGLIHAQEEHAVTHRDLKPSNIFLLSSGGGVKLIDFGIARLGGGTTRTSSGLIGSYDYLAPDFVRMKNKEFRGDEVSDIFSLFVCFYETLTGSVPWPRLGDPQELQYMARWRESSIPLSCSHVVFRTVSQLTHFVSKGLAVDREARFESFAAVQRALHGLRRRILRSPAGEEYELIELLGTGGFAEVFKARRRSDGKEVAIKTLFRGRPSKRFQREAKVLGETTHPAIVRYLDFFEVRGDISTDLCLVMEYLPGGTLADRIRASPTGLPTPVVLRMFVRYLDALRFLHERDGGKNPIIHRDIKPANLYAPPDDPDAAKLMDLGIARTGTKTTGGIPGTWDYMAPEFSLGNTRGSPQTDIYALGLTLYEALSGKTYFPRLPKDGRQAADILSERARGQAPHTPDFSHSAFLSTPALKGIVLRAVARDLSDRYPSADAMRLGLVAVLRDSFGYECESGDALEPPSVFSDGELPTRPDAFPPSVAAVPVRHRSFRPYVLATAAVLMIALGSVMWLRHRAATEASRVRHRAETALASDRQAATARHVQELDVASRDFLDHYPAHDPVALRLAEALRSVPALFSNRIALAVEDLNLRALDDVTDDWARANRHHPYPSETDAALNGFLRVAAARVRLRKALANLPARLSGRRDTEAAEAAAVELSRVLGDLTSLPERTRADLLAETQAGRDRAARALGELTAPDVTATASLLSLPRAAPSFQAFASNEYQVAWAASRTAWIHGFSNAFLAPLTALNGADVARATNAWPRVHALFSPGERERTEGWRRRAQAGATLTRLRGGLPESLVTSNHFLAAETAAREIARIEAETLAQVPSPIRGDLVAEAQSIRDRLADAFAGYLARAEPAAQADEARFTELDGLPTRCPALVAIQSTGYRAAMNRLNVTYGKRAWERYRAAAEAVRGQEDLKAFQARPQPPDPPPDALQAKREAIAAVSDAVARVVQGFLARAEQPYAESLDTQARDLIADVRRTANLDNTLAASCEAAARRIALVVRDARTRHVSDLAKSWSVYMAEADSVAASDDLLALCRKPFPAELAPDTDAVRRAALIAASNAVTRVAAVAIAEARQPYRPERESELAATRDRMVAAIGTAEDRGILAPTLARSHAERFDAAKRDAMVAWRAGMAEAWRTAWRDLFNEASGVQTLPALAAALERLAHAPGFPAAPTADMNDLQARVRNEFATAVDRVATPLIARVTTSDPDTQKDGIAADRDALRVCLDRAKAHGVPLPQDGLPLLSRYDAAVKEAALATSAERAWGAFRVKAQEATNSTALAILYRDCARLPDARPLRKPALRVEALDAASGGVHRVVATLLRDAASLPPAAAEWQTRRQELQGLAQGAVKCGVWSQPLADRRLMDFDAAHAAVEREWSRRIEETIATVRGLRNRVAKLDAGDVVGIRGAVQGIVACRGTLSPAVREAREIVPEWNDLGVAWVDRAQAAFQTWDPLESRSRRLRDMESAVEEFAAIGILDSHGTSLTRARGLAKAESEQHVFACRNESGQNLTIHGLGKPFALSAGGLSNVAVSAALRMAHISARTSVPGYDPLSLNAVPVEAGGGGVLTFGRLTPALVRLTWAGTDPSPNEPPVHTFWRTNRAEWVELPRSGATVRPPAICECQFRRDDHEPIEGVHSLRIGEDMVAQAPAPHQWTARRSAALQDLVRLEDLARSDRWVEIAAFPAPLVWDGYNDRLTRVRNQWRDRTVSRVVADLTNAESLITAYRRYLYQFDADQSRYRRNVREEAPPLPETLAAVPLPLVAELGATNAWYRRLSLWKEHAATGGRLDRPVLSKALSDLARQTVASAPSQSLLCEMESRLLLWSPDVEPRVENVAMLPESSLWLAHASAAGNEMASLRRLTNFVSRGGTPDDRDALLAANNAAKLLSVCANNVRTTMGQWGIAPQDNRNIAAILAKGTPPRERPTPRDRDAWRDMTQDVQTARDATKALRAVAARLTEPRACSLVVDRMADAVGRGDAWPRLVAPLMRSPSSPLGRVLANQPGLNPTPPIDGDLVLVAAMLGEAVP